MKKLLKYRIILLLNSAALLFFGISFLVSPHGMTAGFGISLSNTDSVADVCAVYGGYELAIGLFLAYCALTRHKYGVHFGIIAATIALIGFFAGRLIGILSGGAPTGQTYQYLTMDAVGAILDTFFLIWYFRKDKIQ